MALTQVPNNMMSFDGGAFGFRNKLYNGSFSVWQRGTSFTPTVGTPAYTADRWTVTSVGAAVIASKNAGSGHTSGTDGILLAGAAGNTYVDLSQRLEAQEVQKFKNGNVTISAWFFNNTGSAIPANSLTLSVSTPTAVDNWAGGNQQLGVTFPQACPNGAWTQVVYTFNPSGFTNIANGMSITLRVSALLAGQNAIWSEVQLEPGSTATSFDYRPYGTELALCQRYYEKSFDIGTTPDIINNAGRNGNVIGVTYGDPSGYHAFCVAMKVTKRVAPTIATYSQTSIGGVQVYAGPYSGSASAVGTQIGVNGFTVTSNTYAVNAMAAEYFQWTASAEL